MWGETADEHFRLWLRAGLSGCEFARILAGKAGRVAIETYVDADLPPPAGLSHAFDEHAAAERAVIAVFPRLRTEEAFVSFVQALAEDARWIASVLPKRSPAGEALISLEFVTSNGDRSETMGFAPFGTMPVPRRAPYVAIATWPGARLNTLRGTPPTPPGVAGVVSFLDMSHGMDKETYSGLWNETTENVTRLMSMPEDNAKLYRRTAFVVSAAAAQRLTKKD